MGLERRAEEPNTELEKELETGAISEPESREQQRRLASL